MRYPLDKAGYLDKADSAYYGLDYFHDYEEEDCDNMLAGGYFMVAHPEDGKEYGETVMEKTAGALALILNPTAGHTLEEYPYEGPEAIVELQIRENGEDEILSTHRYHILEKDGEWVAEKL